jgi:BioD-like phosphotransacetylase family protein
MTLLLLLSSRPLVGKTTVATALALALRQRGQRAGLLRLPGDEGAASDAELFARLGLAASGDARQPLELPDAVQRGASLDILIVEAPAGELPAEWQSLGARAILVARYPELTESSLASLSQELGEAFLGTVATCVPRRRQEQARQSLEEAGLRPLALLVEDRTLASPTLDQLAGALEAETLFAERHRDDVLDRVYISSIAADPGQGYFSRLDPKAIIVRSDKPDHQLAALNVGVPCLIISGDLPILSYVLQRAEEDEVPLLLTRLETVDVARRLEELIGAVRLAGDEKARRAAHLLSAAVPPETLLSLAGAAG